MPWTDQGQCYLLEFLEIPEPCSRYLCLAVSSVSADEERRLKARAATITKRAFIAVTQAGRGTGRMSPLLYFYGPKWAILVPEVPATFSMSPIEVVRSGLISR